MCVRFMPCCTVHEPARRCVVAGAGCPGPDSSVTDDWLQDMEGKQRVKAESLCFGRFFYCLHELDAAGCNS